VIVGPSHLTYCSNIHPGESWSAVRANLEKHVVRVAREVAGETPFGVGLRLSGAAARELEAEDRLAELRAFLAANRLYVFTLNGFPHGTFHGTRVKEDVYLPDWIEPERLAYSERLARILAALLPDGVDGTVSSVPVAFRPRVRGPADLERITAALLEHAASLHALRERTGRSVALALEPEPCCYLETLDESACFFRDELFSAAAVSRFRARSGLSKGAAEDSLRRHLVLCLDACHAAVEFEDLESGLARLDAEGIRVGKVQLSAGLRVLAGETPRAALLEPFMDPVYLHQVVAQRAGQLRRWVDLPDALRDPGRDDTEEWRIHFHVPLFLERFDARGELRSTQPFLSELLARHARRPISAQLEIETYTWDVLPEAHRRSDVATAVIRELRWVLAQLRA
jgi:hypothetical protein